MFRGFRCSRLLFRVKFGPNFSKLISIKTYYSYLQALWSSWFDFFNNFFQCAMFTHEEIFKEASARVIHFPGVNKITFYQVKKGIHTYSDFFNVWINIINITVLMRKSYYAHLVSISKAFFKCQLSQYIFFENILSYILSKKILKRAYCLGF